MGSKVFLTSPTILPFLISKHDITTSKLSMSIPNTSTDFLFSTYFNHELLFNYVPGPEAYDLLWRFKWLGQKASPLALTQSINGNLKEKVSAQKMKFCLNILSP